MENTNELKQNKMGTAPLFRLIMSMALPAMFSMLVQALYNIVDSIFVSMKGEAALGAVNLAFPMQFLMTSVAVGTGIGINSLVSRRLGEGRKQEADKTATYSLMLGIFSWLIFLLLGIFAVHPLISVFTNDPETYQYSVEYLSIVFIFSIGIFVEVNIEKTLQGTGNTVFPMAFQLVGAITNIILDPIFIFTFDLGVKGAAIATIIGQIFSMIFALLVLFIRKNGIKVDFNFFKKIDWKVIIDVYRVGLPSIVMQSIGSFMIFGLNLILTGFSITAVNVLGVYYKLQSFIFMPVFGLTHGVMPIMGYNYGAKNKDRLMKSLKYSLFIALVIMGIGLIIFQVFPRELLAMFNATDDMYAIGIPALRLISLCFLPAAVGIMFSTVFQAVGRGIRSLIISLLRQLCLILPIAYVLSFFGVTYVWLAFPLAEILSIIVSVIFFVTLYNKELKFLSTKEPR